MIDYEDLTRAPLYKLQREVFREYASGYVGTVSTTADELARRYAEDEHKRKVRQIGYGLSARQKKMQAKAYIRGLCGEEDPYGGGRGGNFVRPLRSAWRAGKEMRRDILEIGTENISHKGLETAEGF